VTLNDECFQAETQRQTPEDSQTRWRLLKYAQPKWEDAAGPAEINGPRGRIMY
jgi:hypothetical protein